MGCCLSLQLDRLPSAIPLLLPRDRRSAHLVSSVEDSFVAARKNQATKYMRCISNIVPYLPPSICQKPKASANPTCKKMNRGEAAELGAVPELELDQVDEQVVGRRRDGAGGEEACLPLGLGHLARLRNSSWVREVIVQEKRHVGEALSGSWLRRSLWIGRGIRGWGLASGWLGSGGETLPGWSWLEQMLGWWRRSRSVSR